MQGAATHRQQQGERDQRALPSGQVAQVLSPAVRTTVIRRIIIAVTGIHVPGRLHSRSAVPPPEADAVGHGRAGLRMGGRIMHLGVQPRFARAQRLRVAGMPWPG